jgi:hypothetical protein
MFSISVSNFIGEIHSIVARRGGGFLTDAFPTLFRTVRIAFSGDETRPQNCGDMLGLGAYSRSKSSNGTGVVNATMHLVFQNSFLIS